MKKLFIVITKTPDGIGLILTESIADVSGEDKLAPGVPLKWEDFKTLVLEDIFETDEELRSLATVPFGRERADPEDMLKRKMKERKEALPKKLTKKFLEFLNS